MFNGMESSNIQHKEEKEGEKEDNAQSSESDEHYSIDDVGLPKAQIMKIFKESVPPNVMIQKEARHALGHVTVTFVNYLIATATEITCKAKKKTLTANDILAAMEMIEMKDHIPALQEALDEYQQHKQDSSKPQVNTESNPLELSESMVVENLDADTATMLEEEINIMDIDEE